MPDAAFFIHPKLDWQRRYEALRASFVDRLPAKVVADRYGYSAAYIRLLRHQFQQGKLDFSEPVPEGKTKRRRISADVRSKIIAWRHQQLSAGDITELLSEEGVEISVRTIERVLAEEGFHKLPRRTRLKLGQTVKGAQVPERTQIIALSDVDGSRWDCPAAGVFLFAPFLAQLDIEKVVRSATVFTIFPLLLGLEVARHGALRPCRRAGLRSWPWPVCRPECTAQVHCLVDLFLFA